MNRTFIVLILATVSAYGAPVDVAARIRAHVPAKRHERAESPKQRETRLEREKQRHVEIAKVPLLHVPKLVVQPGLIITNISVSAGNVTLGWQGQGTNLVQVQGTATLQQSWTDLGQPSAASQATFPASGRQSFYRLKVGSVVPGSPRWLNAFPSAGGNLSVYGQGITENVNGQFIVGGKFLGTQNWGAGSISSNPGSIPNGFLNAYSASGVCLWTVGIVGEAKQPSFVSAVATDSVGNIFSVGQFAGTMVMDSTPANPKGTTSLTSSGLSGGATDMFVAKYRADGNIIWATNLGTASVFDYGFGVVVDNNNDIIISGAVSNFTSAVYKINGASSQVVWAKTFGQGSANGVAIIKSSANQDVVVTGAFTSTTTVGGITGSGTFLMRLNGTDGSVAWANMLNDIIRVGTPAGGHSVAIDATNSRIYMTGSTNQQFFLGAYTLSGATLWTKTYGVGNQTDSGFGVAVDSASNIIATGHGSGGMNLGGPTDGSGFIVISSAYSPSGPVLRWFWRFTTAGSGAGLSVSANSVAATVCGYWGGAPNWAGDDPAFELPSQGAFSQNFFVVQYNQ